MSESSPRKSKENSRPQEYRVLSLLEKLVQDRAELAKWSTIAADPSLSPAAARVAADTLRSSEAAVRLGEKALAYEQDINEQRPLL